MPGTRDVGKNIKEFKKKNPSASHKQAVAVGLSQAHKSGNKKAKRKKSK